MPAPSSSPIYPVLAHLATAAASDRLAGAGVLAALARVPDPRARRGVRHSIRVILALAACAVLAGCCSFTAIGEWVAACTTPPAGRRRVVALDGKTVRGSASDSAEARHLLAAIDHRSGVVLGQVNVERKTNEVRREAPCRIPNSVRRNSEDSSWVRWLTWSRKVIGDKSLP